MQRPSDGTKTAAFQLNYPAHSYLLGDGDEDKTPPRHTPGQAEGEDEESQRKRPNGDALRRKRPSQAEGEDDGEEADEVPPED